MLLGALVSARVRVPWVGKRQLLLVHEQGLLAVLYATFVHVATVVAHELLPPGAPSIVRALPGSLGLVALLGLALLVLSRWLRERLSQRAFRQVHLVAYAAFFAGAGHAALAGAGGVDVRLRAAYISIGLLVALTVLVRASPAVLRSVGLLGRGPLPRARWRRAMRGKRKTPADPDQRRPPSAA